MKKRDKKNQKKGSFWVRLVDKILYLLKRGVTPREIALTLALAFALGIFPLMGFTAGLCFVATAVLRLNHPLMQTANIMMLPLQLLVWIPFIRLGEWLTGAPPLLLEAREMAVLFKSDLFGALALLWRALLQGFLGWIVVVPVFSLLLYLLILLPLIKRLVPALKKGELLARKIYRRHRAKRDEKV